ncbi:hypothetical protein EUGRSUZ_J02796 [Eucalyptus grandis]|uniref:Uncharacterized protein n=2 Tax=Eucalyptus grandis TaxID=71139 RepID=A0ACC3JA29_EUCGR|nr:hypothetical protein EUGRSUZ_J02796 [Eucalyptus grandis]
MVLPKACVIAGGDKESCWYWITMELKCFRRDANIHVPKSKKLSWLFIQGRFKTRALSPNTTYEVAFVVKLNRTDSEWSSRVELKLNLPDGTEQTNTEDLGRRQEEWINLRAGEFEMGPKTVGTISFALQGTRIHPQKTGLMLKGVLIHPKD